MDAKRVVVYICCVILASAEESIYTMKYICAPELSQTFRKHNCVYNQPSITSPPAGRHEGLARECCDRRCSEYYLITTYCKNSTIHHMTDRPIVFNHIAKDENLENQITQNQEKETEDEKEEIAANMLVKEAPQVSIKFSDLSKKSSKNTDKKQRNKNRRVKNHKRLKINKDCVCTCKTRKRKEERTYKPSVIVLSKISSNPPIPVKRRQR